MVTGVEEVGKWEAAALEASGGVEWLGSIVSLVAARKLPLSLAMQHR